MRIVIKVLAQLRSGFDGICVHLQHGVHALQHACNEQFSISLRVMGFTKWQQYGHEKPRHEWREHMLSNSWKACLCAVSTHLCMSVIAMLCVTLQACCQSF